MKKIMKNVSLATAAFVLLSACNSASSEDAKKVEVKAAAPVAEVAQATTTEEAKTSNGSKFIAGKHYIKLSPEMQTDSAPGKVEVVEMMWLGCPHCYTLEPTMQAYKKSHPDYIEFKQVPAMLNPSWSADAKTYYLADILDPKGENQLIVKTFQAIHDQRRRLGKPDAADRFFVQQGYTQEAIDNVRNSMVFRAKLKRAEEISGSSQANSVPVVIINGKYRTSPYIAGGEENMMEIVRMLTKREKNK